MGNTLNKNRLLIAVILSVIAVLQYKLWFAEGGVPEVLTLTQKVDKTKQKTSALKQRNAALEAEVTDLKHGDNAVEEHARNDLGMTKKGEVIYHLTK